MKYKNNIEKLDIQEIVNSPYINWEFFRDKKILVTGATGLIGSQLVKTFLYANSKLDTNIDIIALARNENKTEEIYSKAPGKGIKFIYQDINSRIKYNKTIDYIIHTANSTTSRGFVEEPAETFNSIIQGTKNILDLSIKCKAKSIVYLSSMEVYGDIPLTREGTLSENDYGYIDILKPRSSYPEGKRGAECMCSAYAKQYNVPVKIVRLAQTIGASVDYADNRVFAQFARNIVERENIVLKTKGETVRSYCYVTDAVVAILSMLEKGNNGESYNIANPDTTCSIKEMAEMLCKKYLDSQLIIEANDTNTQTPNYYLNTLKYELNTSKYEQQSGWKAIVSLEEAYSRLISSFYYQKDKSLTQDISKHKRDYSKDTFWEQIFSFKNKKGSKVLKILGLSMKFDLSKFLKQYYQMPIEKNKIVFSNFEGNGYGCNPKYIAEEIIKRGLNYDIVWLVKGNVNKDDIPNKIRTVPFNSRQALKELITAKVWVDNSRKIYHLKKGLVKRPEQIYIQTWHGSLGIKKLDADVKNFNTTANEVWLTHAQNEGKMIDYLLTNSTFENTILAPALWFKNSIKCFGHPRNDIFFADNKSAINKVRKFYNISEDKRIFLYIPSFRDDGDLSWYNIDYKSTLDALTERFGDKWVFMVRQHPRVAIMKINLIPQDDPNIIDATYYSDIQELLVASDVAMTDYSSCIFDFMLARKPAFIYATDINKYNLDRGFYYPLEATPFPIAKDNEELMENIRSFNYEKYKQDVEIFLKAKGCIEDGKASERVVDLIEKIE